MSPAPSPGSAERLAPRIVSVVVPVLDAAGTLPRQLDALAAQRYAGAWEVVVIDNGSTDASAALAREWSDRLPDLTVIDARERRGINHARNVGWVASRGDFVTFTDADDEVGPGWLSALAEAAARWDMVGGWIDEQSLNDEKTRAWRPPWLPRERLPVLLDFLPFAMSSNCGIWSDVLTAVGGWNEDFARGCTDVELSWRVQLAGYTLGYAPEAVVRYRYRRTLGGLAHQYYCYGRAEPQVYRAFRDSGLQRSNPIVACLSWGWLSLSAVQLLAGPARRGVWIRKAAYRAGRLRGSLRQRVLFL